MQTWRYMIKRILLAAVSLFAIITITYFLMNLMPGDPFMSEKASEENRAILIAKYGLDQPVMYSTENIWKIFFMETWVPVMFFRKEEQ